MANKYAGTQTEKNLMAAFAGESEARNKYTYFASKAKKDTETLGTYTDNSWSGRPLVSIETSEKLYAFFAIEIHAGDALVLQFSEETEYATAFTQEGNLEWRETEGGAVIFVADEDCEIYIATKDDVALWAYTTATVSPK